MDQLLIDNELFFSEEAYFGKTNAFSIQMIEATRKLREEMKKVLPEISRIGERIPEKDLKKFKKILRSKDINGVNSALTNMENIIAHHINVEKVYIGLSSVLNAYTIPLVYDPAMLTDRYEKSRSVKYKLKDEKDLEKVFTNMEDIVIKKDGYKFKSSKGKVIILNIGIPFLIAKDDLISTEATTGIIFHEIGHNFQHLMVGVKQALVEHIIHQRIMSVLLISSVSDPIMKTLITLITMLVPSTFFKPDLSDDEKIRVISYLIEELVEVKNGKLIVRENYGENEKKEILRSINEANKHLREFNGFLKFLIGVCKVVFDLIYHGVGTIVRIIDNFHSILSYGLLYMKHGKVVEYYKRYENFADNFAISYGFGPDTYDTFLQFSKPDMSRQATTLTFLNYIPFVSTAMSVSDYAVSRNITAAFGYNDTSVRYSNSYKSLKFELDNNKDLTKDQRQEITDALEKIQEDYKLFVDESTALESKTFFGRLIIKAMKKNGNIEKIPDKSEFTKNVLEVIHEYEKSGKIPKDKNGEKAFKSEISRSIFKDGLDFVINSFGEKVKTIKKEEHF